MCKYKKLINVFFVYALVSVLLLTSSVPAQAAVSLVGIGTKISTNKIIDMSLNKAGIVANDDLKQSITEQTLNVLNGTATSFRQWCSDNGKGVNTASWEEYLASDAYANLGFRLFDWALVSADFLNYLITGETLLGLESDDLPKMMIGTDTVEKGNEYQIPNVVVNDVYNTFNTMISDGSLGYYYVPVKHVNELPISMFIDNASYQNVKQYIRSSEYVTMIINEGNSKNYIWNSNTLYLFENSEEYLLVRKKNPTDYLSSYLYSYNANWETKVLKAYKYDKTATAVNIVDKETFEQYTNVNSSMWIKDRTTSFYEKTNDAHATIYLYSATGGKQIVYNSLEALKAYNGGSKPYYMITNTTYDESVDNSINFTGDYIQKYGTEYSYDVVQNQIDNSVDNTDNSIHNIVNESNQTIINNYYYQDKNSGDESASDGDSTDGEDTESENGLLNLIGAIGDVLNFILNALAEVVSILASFLSSLLDIVTSLGGIFTSFSGLMGQMFPFIPQELIDLLSAAISAAILISVIKMIRG